MLRQDITHLFRYKNNFQIMDLYEMTQGVTYVIDLSSYL
jgi:hypothetical protein